MDEDVAASGRREVLGFEVGGTESQPFWTSFLRILKTRGLGGVMLDISDAHTHLTFTIETVFAGVSWQRYRVHFRRNVLSSFSEATVTMVASVIRMVVAPPNTEHVFAQFHEGLRTLTRSHLKIADMHRRCQRRTPRVPWNPPAALATNRFYEPAGPREHGD